MLFRPENIPMILNGTKTATRRNWKKSYVMVGHEYFVETKILTKKSHCRIEVTNLFKQKLDDVSDKDALKEGCPTFEDFKQAWVKSNGSWNPNQIVYVIEFKLLDKYLCKFCNKEIKNPLERQIYHPECFKVNNRNWHRDFGRTDKRKKWQKEFIENHRELQCKLQKGYRSRNPEKVKAHQLAKKIKIPLNKECEICKRNLAVHRHHQDYFKPMEVMFLCNYCHRKIHSKYA